MADQNHDVVDTRLTEEETPLVSSAPPEEESSPADAADPAAASAGPADVSAASDDASSPPPPPPRLDRLHPTHASAPTSDVPPEHAGTAASEQRRPLSSSVGDGGQESQMGGLSSLNESIVSPSNVGESMELPVDERDPRFAFTPPAAVAEVAVAAARDAVDDASTTQPADDAPAEEPAGTQQQHPQQQRPPAASATTAGAASGPAAAALSTLQRVARRRDVDSSQVRGVHDRGLLGRGAGKRAVASTRMRSAAEDDMRPKAAATTDAIGDDDPSPLTAVGPGPSPLPPLADGVADAPLRDAVGVAADGNGKRRDPFPLAPSIRSPEPRSVKVADDRTRRRNLVAGATANASSSQRAAPEPNSHPHFHALTPPPRLRPIPDATALTALLAGPSGGGVDGGGAASPDPTRRWEPVGADLAGAARRRVLEPSALRAPAALRRRDENEDALLVMRSDQPLNLKPLTTPQATAAALLKLQDLGAAQAARRQHRGRVPQPLQPIQSSPSPSQPPGEGRSGDRNSSLTLTATEAASNATTSTKPKARAGSKLVAATAAVSGTALYVPPARRRLAPIESMPRGPTGAPLFDVRARRRELQVQAAGLAAALAATSGGGGGGSGPGMTNSSVRPARTRSRSTQEDDKSSAAHPDPIAELVASIPAALRRHMLLPESPMVAAKRRDNDRRMRRCRRETARRLREREEEIDDVVADVQQRSVFGVQRAFRLAAEAAEQQRPAGDGGDIY